MDVRKRLKGAPRGGIVSVVVTDIEGYTALMTQHPEAMMAALQLHNGLLRAAKWKNYGTTVEQEGDSYTLVFHEALDACKFCLQAQQMLEKQSWPPGLFSTNSQTKANYKRRAIPGLLSDFGKTMVRLHTATSNLRRRSSKKGSNASSSAKLSPTQRSGELPPSRGAPMASRSGSGRHVALCKTTEQSAIGLAVASQDAVAGPIRGMRVRMGIYTGTMPEGSALAGSQLVEMAKVVSDAAAGGQILMCASTFSDVCNLGRELGCVDASGLNYSRLGHWWKPWALGKKQRQHQHDEDAVLLDMGTYLFCPKGSELPNILTPHFLEEVSNVFRSQRQRSPMPGQDSQQRALHLYQVLSPCLSIRGCFFGSKLALKSEWKQLDRDYYYAPGALAAMPTSSAVIGVDYMSLPKVTMVFCCVENSKQFSLRHRSRDLRDLAVEVLAVIRSCLLQVPGSYLLRHAENECKWMVAFKSPEAALSWCMAVQECALYASWPQPVLRFWPEERSPDGQLLFKGPRLKMGVCEGFPRSLLPDYQGKADYLGDSINQAARFMDAAAHGGQVACEQRLLESLVSSWFRQQDRGDAKTAVPAPEPSVVEANAATAMPPAASANGGYDAPGRPHERLGSNGGFTQPPVGPLTVTAGLPTLQEDDVSQAGQPLASGLVTHHGSDEAPTRLQRPQRLNKPGSLPRSAVAQLAAWPITQIDVVALHLGTFKFKGVLEGVNMVNVTHAVLAGRRYPAEAPSGKGSRTMSRDGVLASASIPMLPIVQEYRNARMGAVNTPRSLGPSSPPPLLQHSSSGKMLSRVMALKSSLSFASRSAVPESRSRVFSRSQLHYSGRPQLPLKPGQSSLNGAQAPDNSSEMDAAAANGEQMDQLGQVTIQVDDDLQQH